MSSPDELLNEQILQGLREAGDNLSMVRPVCFQVVFPSHEKATAFAQVIMRRGLMVVVEDAGDGPRLDLPYDVNVTVNLKPEAALISRHERNLGEAAATYGGACDGWFCECITSQAQR